MRYVQPKRLSIAAANAALLSEDSSRIIEAIYSLSLYDSDDGQAESVCLALLEHHDISVRRAAVQCLGHIARLTRKLNLEQVLPMLSSLSGNDQLSGQVADALDDLQMYLDR
ncbi:MAG TPA: hypothetical protein VGE52_13550 [Pirellulales bacterium]